MFRQTEREAKELKVGISKIEDIASLVKWLIQGEKYD